MFSRVAQQSARRAFQQQQRSMASVSATGSCLKSEAKITYANPFKQSDLIWIVGLPALYFTLPVVEKWRYASNLKTTAAKAHEYHFEGLLLENRDVLKDKYGVDIERQLSDLVHPESAALKAYAESKVTDADRAAALAYFESPEGIEKFQKEGRVSYTVSPQ